MTIIKIEWIDHEATRNYKVAGIHLAGASTKDYASWDSEAKAVVHSARLLSGGSNRYPVASILRGSVIWMPVPRADAERLVKRQPNVNRRYSIHSGRVPRAARVEAEAFGTNLRGRPLLATPERTYKARHNGIKLGDLISFIPISFVDDVVSFKSYKLESNVIDAPLSGRSTDEIMVFGQCLIWTDTENHEYGSALGRFHKDRIHAAGFKWIVKGVDSVPKRLPSSVEYLVREEMLRG